MGEREGEVGKGDRGKGGRERVRERKRREEKRKKKKKKRRERKTESFKQYWQVSTHKVTGNTAHEEKSIIPPPKFTV